MNNELKSLLENTNDEKLKIFIYRNTYNELGLSSLCVEKDKEIKRLKKENEEIQKLKRLFNFVVIKQNISTNKYELFNISKQDLYAYLYLLRCRILKNEFGTNAKDIVFDEFL